MPKNKSALLAILTDRPIAYHPLFAKLCGGVTAGIFLSQLFYWAGKEKDPDGWTYKTQADFTEETGLTRWEQERARQSLKASGVLEEKRKGIPATMHYKINFDALTTLLESNVPVRGHTSDCVEAIPQTIHTENTTETTSENNNLNSQQPFDQSLWPVWFGIANTVPGWKVTFEQAEEWRKESNICEDLAEVKAYALRDWFTPEKVRKGRNPYATWQNWCRKDRDKPQQRNGNATRANDLPTGVELKEAWGKG